MIKVNDVVAFNNLPDAVWFDILKIEGFIITIREHGTNYKQQTMDKSLVRQVRK